MFGLGCADTRDAVMVNACGSVYLDGLQIIERPARQRAVERALQRVPWKLVSCARIFIVNEDAPAIVIATDEIDDLFACRFTTHYCSPYRINLMSDEGRAPH